MRTNFGKALVPGVVMGVILIAPSFPRVSWDVAGSAAKAGEAMPESRLESRTSARASATATSSSRQGKGCASTATAAAEARADDRHETAYDEKSSSDENGACRSSAHAKARAGTGLDPELRPKD